jgi:hypothetical protein
MITPKMAYALREHCRVHFAKAEGDTDPDKFGRNILRNKQKQTGQSF